MAVEVTTSELFTKIGKLIVQVDIQEAQLALLQQENAALQAALAEKDD